MAFNLIFIDSMIHIGLFEGIGGFSLAAHWAGWDTLATCEINPFGQQVLKHYWPDAYHHGDIKTLTYDTINTELSNRFGGGWRNKPVIITGGFPCQPYSLAGKRLGKEDDRHLWPEMLRVIREVSPEWVVGENVLGLVSWNDGLVFNEVQADLEAAGYEVQPYVLPACAVNAPHRRDRVWFVAHRLLSNADNHGSHGPENRQGNHQGDDRDSTGANTVEQFEGCGCETAGTIANPASQQSERLQPEQREFSNQEQRQFGRNSGGMGDGVTTNTRCSEWENGIHGKEQGGETAKFGNSYTKFGAWTKFPITEPTIRGGNDGLSSQLVGITVSKHRNESIKAYGNAIVPQVAYQIFKAINLYIQREQ